MAGVENLYTVIRIQFAQILLYTAVTSEYVILQKRSGYISQKWLDGDTIDNRPQSLAQLVKFYHFAL